MSFAGPVVSDARRAVPMSYDLAVWEGERPADDAAAARLFSDPLDPYIGMDEPAVPRAARIEAFVAVFLRRRPDLTGDDDDDSPWSTAPLIG
ncbi:hypothetical protein GCM10010431_74590 [Streptomyces kunmingensis]